jgi:acyl-CoA thioester hydrolase
LEAPVERWDFPRPHLVTLDVQPADIDSYGHVNNAVYLTWFDRVAWSHSTALGISEANCIALRRGMAALSTHIDFVRAALAGDRVEVGTWILANDGRLRCERAFQAVRADGVTLARARTQYVCLNLDTGRATRMPELFQHAYVETAAS